MPNEASYSYSSEELVLLLKEHLTSAGYEVIMVNNMDLYEEALSSAKEGDVIINLHGNIIPVPVKFASRGYSGVLDFIRQLAVNISSRAIAFINLFGIPFEYASCKKASLEVRLGLDGINTFLSILGAKADFEAVSTPPSLPSLAYLTDVGRNASLRYSLTLPEEVTPGYCISSNIMPLAVFYSTGSMGYLGPFYSAAIFKLGSGAYIHIAVDTSADVKAVVAAAMIAYAMDVLRLQVKTYLIAASDAEWYRLNPSEAIPLITTYLSSLEIDYVLINNTDQLHQVIEDALSSHSSIVLVNLHGEVLPIPAYYIDQYGEKAVEVFINDIAELVSTGSIFVNLAGYPLYVASNKARDYWNVIGERGLIILFSSATNFSAGALCWTGTNVYTVAAGLTSFGTEVARLYAPEISKMWSVIWTSKAISTTLPVIFSIYEVPWRSSQYGKYMVLCALKFGRGLFVHGGLNSLVPSDVVSYLTAITVMLISRHAVTVELRDKLTGATIPNALVEVTLMDGTLMCRGITDGNGRVSFQMPYGEYQIRVLKDEYPPYISHVVMLEESLIKIELKPFHILVTVIDERSGTKLSNVLLEVYREEDLVASATTDDMGRALMVLPRGTYRLEVKARGYYNVTIHDIELEEAAEVIVYMKPCSATLRVLVFNGTTGEPIAGAVVEIYKDGNLILRETTDDNGLVVANVHTSSLRVKVYVNSELLADAIVDTTFDEVDLVVPYVITPEEYRRLKNLLRSLQSEVTSLRQEIDELRQKYSKLKSAYTALKSSYKKLRLEFNSLKKAYDELKKEYEVLSTRYEELLDEFTTLNETYNKLVTNYKDMLNRYTMLRDSYAELMLNYTTVSREYERLSKEYEDIKSRFEELEAEYTELVERHKKLSAQLASLINEYDRLKRDHKALEEKYIGMKTSMGIMTSLLVVLGITGGLMLGYFMGRRRGEYLVIK